jgi:hypothetical protein
VFLQNITGFMVGRKYENEGIARQGAKMVTAVATTAVPKVTVLMGGSFGAGNYGMAGRAYSPRFLWSWPNSRIAVMGGEQAAGRARAGPSRGIERKGGQWSPEEEAEFKRPTLEMFERQSHPLYASARLLGRRDRGPAPHAEVLALSLAASLNAPIEPTRFGVLPDVTDVSSRILIANRGRDRLQRHRHRAAAGGRETVAVYSDRGQGAPACRHGDGRCGSGRAAAESYLRGDDHRRARARGRRRSIRATASWREPRLRRGVAGGLVFVGPSRGRSAPWASRTRPRR